MLKIVEFIQKNKNWRELLSSEPYNLLIKEDDNYIIFNYIQFSSDFNEEICCEARGLILNKYTLKPVRMAFKKFFNIDELFAAKIDWSTASATEKMDGSIISVWYDNNDWHVSTNGVIDARNAPNATKQYNFRQLFDIAANNSNLSFDKLNKNYCYTFELVSPESRVIICYNDTKLYHLSTRDMTTLKEIEEDIGVEKPKIYKFNDENDIRNIVNSLDNSHEGVVVKDINGNRVKIKTKTYFIMHYLVSKMQLVNAIELVRLNDYYEFISYFNDYAECFDCIKAIVDHIYDEAKQLDNLIYNLHKSYLHLYNKNAEQKVKAKIVSATKTIDDKYLFTKVMTAYDNDLYNYLSNCTTPRFIRANRNYFKKLIEAFPQYFSEDDLNKL